MLEVVRWAGGPFPLGRGRSVGRAGGARRGDRDGARARLRPHRPARRTRGRRDDPWPHPRRHRRADPRGRSAITTGDSPGLSRRPSTSTPRRSPCIFSGPATPSRGHTSPSARPSRPRASSPSSEPRASSGSLSRTPRPVRRAVRPPRAPRRSPRVGRSRIGGRAAYLEAARRRRSAATRVRLERAAAEQLLTSGRIDEGAAVLRRVLVAAGTRAPRTPLGALLPAPLPRPPRPARPRASSVASRRRRSATACASTPSTVRDRLQHRRRRHRHLHAGAPPDARSP